MIPWRPLLVVVAISTSTTTAIALDLPLAFLWAYGSYRTGSLWSAVFFHSFHNTISQWLLPKFFAGGDNERWLGEAGILPVAGYVVVSVTLYVWMRQRGQSWRALALEALEMAEQSSAKLSRSWARAGQ